MEVEEMTMTQAEFRRLALGLPDAVESSHMGHPDFRAGGRIFATLGYPDRAWAMIKLPPEDQAFLLRAGGAAFQPASGAWGRAGSTLVQLRAAPKATVMEALRIAKEAATAGPRGGRAASGRTGKPRR
jgi:hypothetical protein